MMGSASAPPILRTEGPPPAIIVGAGKARYTATMRYVSTRGQAPVRDFAGVLLAGLAEDGGLYVPETWPVFSPAEWRAMRGLPYPELAARVMQPFVDADIPLQALCAKAYAGFNHPAVAPLVQLETGLFVQELFHGPTLAFKDMAMQLLGRLFDHVLTRQDQRVTIIGATSGDTGSAAIEACRGLPRVDLVMLHPQGRTSEVQRRQMTSVIAPNIGNVAVVGSFDDCQDLVKAMFADVSFREEMRLSAVNSINWARIAAQIPYYAAAALALGGPDVPVGFSVPTGNFGNILAAYGASRMGLPISRLIVGSNENDILSRFLNKNDMSVAEVHPTLSPSMDIQVSSNFERLLFELLDRDPRATARTMSAFRATGAMRVPEPAWLQARRLFTGYLADPHTAIGVAAARAQASDGAAMIAMATAHPAKFPDAVVQATGIHPPLPKHLADLYDRPECFITASADLTAIEATVRATVLRNAA